MSVQFVFIATMIWAAFLVLVAVGVFGNKREAPYVAGYAAVLTVFFLLFLGCGYMMKTL